MSDDFLNDDFLKELEEAGNSLMEEFTTAKDKKTVITQESNKQSPKTKPSQNIPLNPEPNYAENEIKSKASS